MKMYVKVDAKIPWRSFPQIYGFIDKSVLATILQTCNNTDIPPTPKRKAVIIILIEIFLHAIQEIVFIPFVISKKPVTKGAIKLVSILIMLNIGERIFTIIKIIPLDFKIDIITEKRTIKPPINKIVEILEVKLLEIISPKLEKLTVFLVE